MNYFPDQEILQVLLMDHEVRTAEQEKTLQIFLLKIPFIQRLYSKRQNLETTEVLQLFSQVNIIQKSKGSIVYHQDEVPLGLYIIVQGTIASLIMKSNSQIERERSTFNPKKRYFGHLLYKLQKKQQKKKLIKDPSKKKKSDKKQNPKKENKQDIDDIIDEIKPMRFQQLEEPFKLFDLFGVFLFNKVGEFNPFSELGESSLVERTFRNQSIICLTDCLLLEVSKDLYNQILLWEQQQKLLKKMAFFRRALRVQIPDNILISFCNSFQKMKQQKGNTVYAQGEKVEFIYLIKKGEVQMTHLSNQITAEINDLDRLYSKQVLTKKTTELGIVSPGQFFGVSEAIRGCKRETGAKVLSAVASIYLISIQEFQVQLDKSSRLAQTFNIYKINIFGSDAAQNSQSPQKMLKDLLNQQNQPNYLKKNQYIKIQKNWMPFTTVIKNKNEVLSKLNSQNPYEKIIFLQDFFPTKAKKSQSMHQNDKNQNFKLQNSMKTKKSFLVQVIEQKIKISETAPLDEYSIYRNDLNYSQIPVTREKNQQRKCYRTKSVQRPQTEQKKNLEVNGLNIRTIQVEENTDILKNNIPKSQSLPQTQKKMGQVLHSKEEMFKIFPDLQEKNSTKNSNTSQYIYRRILNRETIK